MVKNENQLRDSNSNETI